MIGIGLLFTMIGLLLYYKPSLDETSEGELLLWYNGKNNKREYIKIY